MKTHFRHLRVNALIILFFAMVPAIHAQEDTLAYLPVQGRIVDSESNDPVFFANVYLEGTNIGTVSNSEGEFLVKIPMFIENKVLVISSMGYRNMELPVSGLETGYRIIKLEPATLPIREVTIINQDARELILNALSRIRNNYSPEPVMMTSFFLSII